MQQAVQQIYNEPKHTIEIVVHVGENLEEGQRHHLVSTLQKTDGIVAAEFCPLRYHLMLVRYNRDLMSSQDVLKNVISQNVHAYLVGPI